MPHVIVKLWPGKSVQQKGQLCDAIVRDVTSILGYGDKSISVALEEVDPEACTEDVFRPDILDKWGNLIKKPGHGQRPDRREGD